MKTTSFIKKNKNLLIGGGALLTIGISLFFMLRKNIANKLVAFASKFKGQRCLPKNGQTKMYFENADFAAKMKAVKWYAGADWCDFFVKMCLTNISKGNAQAFFSKMTGSTQVDFKTLKSSNYTKLISKPEVGCLVFYQNLNDSSKGHVEIVSKLLSNGGFRVISGNSSNSEVKICDRQKSGINNKRILGFIKIKKIK